MNKKSSGNPPVGRGGTDGNSVGYCFSGGILSTTDCCTVTAGDEVGAGVIFAGFGATMEATGVATTTGAAVGTTFGGAACGTATTGG